MKFELKTENKKYSETFSHALRTICTIALIFILFDALLKLRIISRNYQIDYNCSLLSVEKTTSNFNKLSRLSKLKSKQRIWEFCKEIIK